MRCMPWLPRDRGGKHAHLVVSVRLVVDSVARSWVDPLPGQEYSMAEILEAGESPDTEEYKIPLKITLLYESGQRVSDHEILKLMHSPDSTPALTLRYMPDGEKKGEDAGSWRFEGDVHYRLEKVSLRNDGRRFKIAIDIDTGREAKATMEHLNSLEWTRNGDSKGSKTHDIDLHESKLRLSKWIGMARGCSSCPVTVLSKRKHGNSGSPGRGVQMPPGAKRGRYSSGVGSSPAHGGHRRQRIDVKGCEDMQGFWAATTPEAYGTTLLQSHLEESNPQQLALKMTEIAKEIAENIKSFEKKIESIESMLKPLIGPMSLFLASITHGGEEGSGSDSLDQQVLSLESNIPCERSMAFSSSSATNAIDSTIVLPWTMHTECSAGDDSVGEVGVNLMRTDDECMSQFLCGNAAQTDTTEATADDQSVLRESLTSTNIDDDIPEEALSMPMPLSHESDRAPSWGPIKAFPEGNERISVETSINSKNISGVF